MSKKRRVLVVEDEADIRELMLLHLKREQCETAWAEDGESALALIAGQSFDLIVLDWMLPRLSGLEVCKRLKRQVPVLMVTARADAVDIVDGLDAGADDYVTKPFEIPVLLARVRALFRRTERRQSGSNVYRAGSIVLDEFSHEVRVDAEKVHVTPSEFKLLHALLSNEGCVLSREKLIELVQGDGIVVVDRAIDTHICGLRKRLGLAAEVIETIRGVGYRVNVDGSS